MNLNPGIENRYKFQSRHGFALVAALSLMAFILVLVVTLLSLTEVETRSADNNLEFQKAREGARLALSMAVGQLQQYAGNDQRATARAEILGVDSDSSNRFEDAARYWTGVWSTDGSSSGWPKWLVSWHTPNTEPDPSSLPADSVLMLLAGPGSGISDSEHYVYAPRIDVFDENNNVTSRIAWWVSDEGVKASVGWVPLTEKLGDPDDIDYPLSPPSFTDDNSLNTLHTLVSNVHGLEEIFNGYSRFTSSDAGKLDRISDIGQLPGLADFATWLPTEDAWNSPDEYAFHTVTPLSLGILSSTAGSGLMEDLSLFPDLLGSEFKTLVDRGVAVADAKSSLDTGSVATLSDTVGLRGLEITGFPSNGSIANVTTPILTNFMMAFAIYETGDASSGAPSYLRMHFFCEFWNPFTSTLAMKNGNDDLELELEVTGLPEVEILISNGGTGTTNTGAIVDIQNLLEVPTVPSSTAGPLTIRLKVKDGEDEAWLPGMTKNWTGISSVSSEAYISDQTKTKDWSSDNQTFGGASGVSTGVTQVSDLSDASTNNDEIALRSIESDPDRNIFIKVFIVDTGTDEKFLLSQISDINYQLFETPLFSVDSSNPSLRDSRFGYHFILKGPKASNDDATYHRGVWLAENDPRNPAWSLGAGAYMPVINGSQPAATDPSLLMESNIDIAEFSRLFDRSGSDADAPSVDSDTDSTNDEYNKSWQTAPLFELPRERILSLASLQHLYFHGERPFRVGNSWGQGGNFNTSSINTLEWFDKYYFSGLDGNDTLESFNSREGFPNPVLTSPTQVSISNVATDAQALAQKAYVANRFNINSTSVAAWKAILRGLAQDKWLYLDYPDSLEDSITTVNDDERVRRSRMFARFSHSLSETYDVFVTPEDIDEIVAPSEYYRRGARYLKNSQLDTLALRIVDLIDDRQVPFFSMESFLEDPDSTDDDGSVLEQAIAAALNSRDDDDTLTTRQKWDRSWETEGIINTADDEIDIDHFSPGFLTQADIMTAIGPMLAPRSDTFKIRARCQTLSPFDSNDVIGDATIEAVVQRVPEQVEGDNDINDSSDRKFKIMSIRWLTADEI